MKFGVIEGVIRRLANRGSDENVQTIGTREQDDTQTPYYYPHLLQDGARGGDARCDSQYGGGDS